MYFAVFGARSLRAELNTWHSTCAKQGFVRCEAATRHPFTHPQPQSAGHAGMHVDWVWPFPTVSSPEVPSHLLTE